MMSIASGPEIGMIPCLIVVQRDDEYASIIQSSGEQIRLPVHLHAAHVRRKDNPLQQRTTTCPTSPIRDRCLAAIFPAQVPRWWQPPGESPEDIRREARAFANRVPDGILMIVAGCAPHDARSAR